MIRFVPFLMLAGPVWAAPVAATLPCDPGLAGCVTVLTLRDFDPLQARPVWLGDRLRMVGVTTGDEATEALVTIDLGLGGALVAPRTLDARAEEMTDAASPASMPFRTEAEFAPDGSTLVVFGHGPGPAGANVGQVFDSAGARLGQLDGSAPAGWPVQVDWTAVDLMRLSVGQNTLRFADGMMSVTAGRFVVTARLEDGQVSVVETRPADQPDDDLALALDRVFDPVGREVVWQGTGLTAVTNAAADGFPAQLVLVRGEGERPLSRSPDAVVLDANAGDYSRDYRAPVISPDGARVAVIRTSDEPETGPIEVLVYDSGSAALIWTAALDRVSPRPAPRYLVWVGGGRLALIEGVQAEAMRVTVLAPDG